MVCSLATVTLTCLITFLLFSFHLLLKIEQTKKSTRPPHRRCCPGARTPLSVLRTGHRGGAGLGLAWRMCESVATRRLEEEARVTKMNTIKEGTT